MNATASVEQLTEADGRELAINMMHDMNAHNEANWSEHVPSNIDQARAYASIMQQYLERARLDAAVERGLVLVLAHALAVSVVDGCSAGIEYYEGGALTPEAETP